MRILLDTHIFLWSVKNDRKLKKETRNMIIEADEVYVSSASIWEAAIKIKIGKLDVDLAQVVESISLSGFSELPISAQHALTVLKLPDLHKDPFDRMLIAQAMVEPLMLITADPLLKDYSPLVKTVG